MIPIGAILTQAAAKFIAAAKAIIVLCEFVSGMVKKYGKHSGNHSKPD